MDAFARTLWIATKSTVARLSLVAALVTAAAACGTATESAAVDRSWNPISIEVPRGARQATIDAERDRIWMATCPLAPSLEQHALVTLTVYDAATRQARTVPSSYACRGPDRHAPIQSEGSIGSDAAGNVWFLTGWILARYSPASDSFASWPIPGAPSARETIVAGTSPPSSSSQAYPDRLAITQGVVNVRVLGVPTIHRFDIGTEKWLSSSLNMTGSANAESGPIEALPDGRLAVGVDSPAGGVWIVDPSTGLGLSTGVRAGNFTVGADGRVVFVDARGEVAAYDPTSKVTSLLGVRLEAPPGVTPAIYFRDVPLWTGPDGSIWVHDAASIRSGQAWFLRLSEQAATERVSVPDIKRIDLGPKPSYVGPGGAGGLLFDAQGGVWLPTSPDFGDKADWAPLYHLPG